MNNYRISNVIFSLASCFQYSKPNSMSTKGADTALTFSERLIMDFGPNWNPFCAFYCLLDTCLKRRKND